ncbi:MAG: efflux RND transporter periplasmic adaptor subunit [Gammaproteobacteria bacterium]
MRLSKPMMIMVLALVIIFGGIFGWNITKNMMMAHYFATQQPPPVSVSTFTTKSEIWQPYINAIGSVSAINGVYISTEVAGIVKQINFISGQFVKKNDLLILLDDSVEEATLQSNQAELVLNKANLARTEQLWKQKVASAASYDQARANYLEALAAVNKTIALINQKHIVAPFDGKIGIRYINLGQYVGPGTKIVSLQSLDPLFVNFSIPEQYLKNIRVGQTILVHVDTFPNQTFQGQLTAIDAETDKQTHNILLQATVPNHEGHLYPGLYANINIVLPQQMHVITVPQTSINYSLFGDSVYVVYPDGKDESGKTILRVKRRFVVTGEERNNLIVITKGLKPGETIVTAGQLSLDNGTAVTINNSVTTNIPNQGINNSG